jgi:heme/copper-type cytochrome/quinol oxidase subunit 4
MADEKKEKWTNYLAITTVIIAVCATLSTFKGGGYSTKSLMNQTQASDKWSFFQSKSLKSYIFEMQKDNLELQRDLYLKSNASKEVLAKYDDKIAYYTKKIEAYEVEKANITAEAKKLEAGRDECKLHSTAFGIAVIFLQISILLSSISALAKKKYVWYISLAMGVIGIFYFIDGFFLIVH